MNLEQWDGGEVLMDARYDSLLEHTGTVIESDANSALVETVRQSACGHCSAGHSCGTSVLAGLFKHRCHRVRVSHDLELRAGDTVVLGIPESALLRAAVLAYMVPLLMMIAFAMFATLAGLGDLIVFASSLAGLFTGLYLAGAIRAHKVSDEIVLLHRASACTPDTGFVVLNSNIKRGKQP